MKKKKVILSRVTKIFFRSWRLLKKNDLHYTQTIVQKLPQ